VDDNATNRFILEAMLRSWSMVPVLAADGETALAELERIAQAGTPYPLVLLDSMMPGMSGFDLAARIRERPHLVGVAIMMLTSEDVLGHAARCRALGVAAYLIKPIKQSELRRAIEVVLGTVGNAVPGPEPTGNVVDSRSGQPATRSLRVLLAEDNAINQHLAVSLLRKQGHTVTVAADGRRAVQAWESESFDVVLMDVQMPEMDGFEATAAIRSREGSTGRHTPIIAMTAHAMQGDRERCLAAGMDDYIPKPVRSHDLAQAIARMFAAPGAESTGTTEKLNPEFDRNAALAAAEGDEELLQRMARLFEDQSPVLLEQVRRALHEDDGKALCRAAHTLKGSLGSVGATSAWEATQELEHRGASGDVVHARAAYRNLEQEIAKVLAVLAEFTRVHLALVATSPSENGRG